MGHRTGGSRRNSGARDSANRTPSRRNLNDERERTIDAIVDVLDNYPDGARAAEAVIARLYGNQMAAAKPSRRLLLREIVEEELAHVLGDMDLIGERDPQMRDAAVVVRAVALALLHRRTDAFRSASKNKSERTIMRAARTLMASLGGFASRDRALFVDDRCPHEATIVGAYERLARNISDIIRFRQDPATIAAMATGTLLCSSSHAPLREKCRYENLLRIAGFDPTRRGPGVDAAPERVALAKTFTRILHDHGERRGEAAPKLRDALLRAAGVKSSDLANWSADADRRRKSTRS